MTGLGSQYYLGYDGLGLSRILLQIVSEGLAHGCRYCAGHFRVAKLGFGLSFELWLHHLYRDYCGKTFAEVVAGDFYLGVFKQVVVFGVLFESRGQTAAKTAQMRAALDSVDIVYKRVHVLVVSIVVSQGYLHRNTLAFGVQVYHVANQRFLVGVDVAYKLAQTGIGVESFAARLAVFVEVAQVGKVKCYAGVEKCEVAQTVCQGLIVVFGNDEYRSIGLEGY